MGKLNIGTAPGQLADDDATISDKTIDEAIGFFGHHLCMGTLEIIAGQENSLDEWIEVFDDDGKITENAKLRIGAYCGEDSEKTGIPPIIVDVGIPAMIRRCYETNRFVTIDIIVGIVKLKVKSILDALDEKIEIHIAD